jgi:hypothetical protein
MPGTLGIVRSSPTVRALCASALLLILAGSTGGATAAAPALASPEIASVPGLAPVPQSGRAFRNLDPAYKRASYYERLHYIIVKEK